MEKQNQVKKLLADNESSANRMVAVVLLAMAALFAIAGVLFLTHIWVGKFWTHSVPMIVSAVICLLCGSFGRRKKGRGGYLKYLMMTCMLLTITEANILSGYVLWLAYAIPMIITIRYYYTRLSVITGLVTAFCMFVCELAAVWFSPLVDHLNVNYVSYDTEVLIPVVGQVDDSVIVFGFDRWLTFFHALRDEYLPLLMALGLVVGISVYVTYRGVHMMEVLEKNMGEAAQLEHELRENEKRLMASEVQPHFIFNTLNTIYYLCDSDPEAAQEAITNFSGFMRGNMDAIQQNEPIPFEQELKHIQQYLWIEKLRFDDRLQVRYEIGPVDFSLPALSVQTIVQNAVKYGIRGKQAGGTVTIATEEREDCYAVVVSDDGAGFDVSRPFSDGRSHTGIENTQMRLKMMMNGSLEVTSAPGSGTMVTLLIPKAAQAPTDHREEGEEK